MRGSRHYSDPLVQAAYDAARAQELAYEQRRIIGYLDYITEQLHVDLLDDVEREDQLLAAMLDGSADALRQLAHEQRQLADV